MTVTALSKTNSDTPTPAVSLGSLEPATVRESAGLTKAEMARLLGMSENGYIQWENGTRRPGGPAFRLLYLIATEQDITLAALRAA